MVLRMCGIWKMGTNGQNFFPLVIPLITAIVLSSHIDTMKKKISPCVENSLDLFS